MNYIEGNYRPTAFTMEIPKSRIHDWLYYETGFEQMHFHPDISIWMMAQGWVSGIDWKLEKRPSASLGDSTYHITFTNIEMADCFLLRWSC
jgi:hypothetical protein